MVFDRAASARALSLRSPSSLANAGDHGSDLLSATGGVPWRLLPDSFPPWRTVYRWFCTMRDDGVFESLNHHLVQIDRIRTEREPMPSAAVIDGQSVKATEAGEPRGYDAGKKIMGASNTLWSTRMVVRSNCRFILRWHSAFAQAVRPAAPLGRARLC